MKPILTLTTVGCRVKVLHIDNVLTAKQIKEKFIKGGLSESVVEMAVDEYLYDGESYHSYRLVSCDPGTIDVSGQNRELHRDVVEGGVYLMEEMEEIGKIMRKASRRLKNLLRKYKNYCSGAVPYSNIVQYVVKPEGDEE